MESRFPVFVAASFVLFIGLLLLCLRRRETKPGWTSLLAMAAVVVVGGMVFAKWGATSGLPWWVYYPVPALLTLILPPAVYKMARRETLEYLILAFLMAPAIHAVFSLVLGWKEYMPFLSVPSLSDLFPT